MTSRLAFRLKEAAEVTLADAAQLVPYGEKTLRAAIHGRSEHLPPLPAKRGSKRELFVLYDDLVEWAKSLPDA